MRQVKIYDTTLRDGTQAEDFVISLWDEIRIAQKLAQLGVHYLEGGWPGANPKDKDFFTEIRNYDLGLTRVAAFGSTHHKDRQPDADSNMQELLLSRAPVITIFGKSSPFQVKEVLKTTLERNLELITSSLAYIKPRVEELIYDAEHFFDGLKEDREYALASLQAAVDGGAEILVLCDTNGGALPHEVEDIVGEVCKVIPGDRVGIHAHNDTEQAVANSFAAIRAGARQIQGTLNGLGERCGNANLVSIIPTLKLKPEYADKFEINVSDAALGCIVRISHGLDELLNRAPDRHAPYVGESAFATKAGIHASAIVKEPKTYEHIAPERVGNKRKLLVSDQAGRSNVLAELERIGLSLDKDDPRVTRLLDEVKEREAIGYAYEAADASFELLARRMLGQVPHYFNVEKFDVNVEQRNNAKGERVTVSQAVVKIKVGDEELISVAEGIGPVNALDLALRKDLGKYQSFITGLTLTDYRVRILNGGTQAVTRVLIESTDETGEHWRTVGLSANIIDASFQALMDSIVYKLMKSGAPA